MARIVPGGDRHPPGHARRRGDREGFLAQQALVVNGLALPSVRTILESMAGGTTDFGLLPNRTLILVAGLRLPLKIVARGGWRTETEVVVPAGAAQPESVD